MMASIGKLAGLTWHSQSTGSRWFKALSLALATLALVGCEKSAKMEVPPAKATWATPVRQTVQDYATFDATAQAMNAVKLVARVPGYLTNILYKDGSDVKKGDLLFVIEQDQYKEQVALHQAVFDEAQIEYNRQMTLLGQKATSQAAVDQARSKLQQAQAQLELAKINLGYTEIRAPFDGRVSRHLIDVGNYLGSNPQGIELAEIRQLQPIYLYFSMNEMEVLNYLRANKDSAQRVSDMIGKLPVYAQLQGEDGFPHKGVLDYVASNIDVKTGTLQLRARFDNESRHLLPGLYAKVLINYGPARESLLVPYEVVQRDQQGPYVFLLGSENKVQRRNIKLGQRYGSLVEVLDGLGDSDKVIVNGFVTLSDGQTVEPQQGRIEPAKLPGQG